MTSSEAIQDCFEWTFKNIRWNFVSSIVTTQCENIPTFQIEILSSNNEVSWESTFWKKQIECNHVSKQFFLHIFRGCDIPEETKACKLGNFNKSPCLFREYYFHRVTAVENPIWGGHLAKNPTSQRHRLLIIIWEESVYSD